MRAIFRKLRSGLVEHGAPIFLLFLVSRSLAALSGGRVYLVPYALVAQPVGAQQGSAPRPDPRTITRKIAPDDPLIAAFPRTQDVVRVRFSSGSVCYATTAQGRFAGHVWVAHGQYLEDEVKCLYCLADAGQTVWDFDVYVEPRFRVGRTLSRMWAAVDQALAVEGVKWTFSRISLFNPASLKAHCRLGAIIVGRATFLVLGRWQVALCRPFPYVHVTGPGGDGPILRLAAPSPSTIRVQSPSHTVKG